MTSPFINVVAVDQSKKNSKYVKDIIAAYHSAAFQKAIKSHAEFKGYKLPSYFK
ncbi:MetQ/NlpA family ABC transporter substrate-binding protein [Terrilactibacillus sp. S3-3]|nr:MetQ/NlpA family ABC transporter substrate-binding protein [Terrilactibacillus sp. S3-3]